MAKVTTKKSKAARFVGACAPGELALYQNTFFIIGKHPNGIKFAAALDDSGGYLNDDTEVEVLPEEFEILVTQKRYVGY